MEGVGAMLYMLTDKSKYSELVKESLGKTILECYIDNNILYLEFTSNGDGITIYDNGQSCCEDRYMVTDDDLLYYIGATLLDISIESVPSIIEEHGDHEIEFLHIKTSKGSFTISNHNEHNGYYGGFAVIVENIHLFQK